MTIAQDFCQLLKALIREQHPGFSVGMTNLPTDTGIRGYPTRRVRVQAGNFARGRGYGQKTSSTGTGSKGVENFT
jgi:hypothetical protein